jgi:hypothetical protein
LSNPETPPKRVAPSSSEDHFVQLFALYETLIAR